MEVHPRIHRQVLKESRCNGKAACKKAVRERSELKEYLLLANELVCKD